MALAQSWQITTICFLHHNSISFLMAFSFWPSIQQTFASPYFQKLDLLSHDRSSFSYNSCSCRTNHKLLLHESFLSVMQPSYSLFWCIDFLCPFLDNSTILLFFWSLYSVYLALPNVIKIWMRKHFCPTKINSWKLPTKSIITLFIDNGGEFKS